MAPIRVRPWFAAALALAATLAVCGFGPGGASARPSAASAGWGKAVLLAGLTKTNDSQVSAISCSAPGNCVATGSYGAGFAPTVRGRMFVVNQIRGAWGKPATLRGLARTKEPASSPAGLACFPAGSCVLVGSYKDAAGRSQAFITSQVHGTWSKISWVPGLAGLDRGHSNGLSELSCPSAGNCTAAGTYADAAGASHPFVVAQVHGKWGSALAVPDLAGLPGQVADTIPGLGPISCASAGNCALAGTYSVTRANPDSGSNQVYVDNEVNGVWGTPTAVPGLAALNADLVDSINAISCPAPGDCSAGGQYTDSELSANAFVVNETNGTWGTATEVKTQIHSNWITSISCPSSGNCVAGGVDNVDEDALSSSAFIVTETRGTWGEAVPVPGIDKLNQGDQGWLNQISCSSVGNCGIAGFTSVVYGFGFIYTQPFVDNQVHGKWGQATLVPGIKTARPNDGQAAGTTAISCTGSARCSVGGYYQSDDGSTHAFVASRP
jgi:hypothetical protein